jgi:sulfur carrier protein
MKVLVNGVWRDTAVADVASALKELGYGESVVATALNGEFVPMSSRSEVALTEGDRLEVVAPMQGG